MSYIKSLFISLYRKLRIYLDLAINFNLDFEELRGNLKDKTKFKFNLSYSFNLPYKNGRTIRGFSFENKNKDVHSIICRDLKNGKSVESVTENFFKSYKIHEKLSIGDFIDELNEPKFKKLPLWSIVNPWSSISLKNSKMNYLNSFFLRRKNHGLNFENSSLSYVESKMYSYEDAESQVLQHKRLFEMIRKNGYKQNYLDLPTAVLLFKKDEWRWMMAHSGNHRAHILYENGHEFLRCKISRIVNFDSLNKLKNVRNGDYTLKQAKILFNRAFDGKNPVRGPK